MADRKVGGVWVSRHPAAYRAVVGVVGVCGGKVGDVLVSRDPDALRHQRRVAGDQVVCSVQLQ
jgi:hypothetical protein